jgi:DNA-binding transcriptional regulator YdaS (Cro superfamily)
MSMVLQKAAVAESVWSELKHSQPRMMSDIAQAIGIRVQAVSQWRRVPIERVDVVARVTGIPAQKLRPDWPWPPPISAPLAPAKPRSTKRSSAR